MQRDLLNSYASASGFTEEDEDAPCVIWLTDTKRNMGLAILYHFGLAVPSFWNEGISFLEIEFSWHLVRWPTCVYNFRDSRLLIVYRGTAIVVYSGMKRPAITIPSGGVSPVTAVGIAGYKRRVSSMTAFKCGSSSRACESCVSMSATSAKIVSACCGYIAKQYSMKISVGAEESLLESILTSGVQLRGVRTFRR